MTVEDLKFFSQSKKPLECETKLLSLKTYKINILPVLFSIWMSMQQLDFTVFSSLSFSIYCLWWLEIFHFQTGIDKADFIC